VLNFAAGQTTANFTVTALNDLILESPETVNLVLSGANASSNPSILTILDVPPTPTPTPTPTTVPTYFFSVANYSVNEGSSASITINRSGNISQPSAILFSTGDGSAQSTSAPADYNSVTQGVFFAAGQTSAQVSVQTLFDPLTESAETVNLFLSGGSLANPSLAVLSIIDPTFVAPTLFSYGSSPGSVADGLSGTFTINRTGNTSASASVDYLIAPPTVPGQPFNFIDYTINPLGNFTGGTVNFNPGQTSVSLTINNTPGLTGGNVGLSFAPNTNVGIPGSTTITLL
uniref:Calx-beta domain-containing protein n=1 Tax=Microcoleus sp. TaxID=44472 RepID=UPI00403EF4FC